tara:strand:- start:176 stop:1090 length:915 start_codon:yes stop_codon:yes gene_type:complete
MSSLINIDGFKISFHEKSKRIIKIIITNEVIDKLIFPFNKFNVSTLEYKPFTRFTVSKSLEDLSKNKLGSFLKTVLKDRNTGCVFIEPEKKISKIDQNFLIKLSTAITHLVGVPNHDSMSDKYYARFDIKHEDESDSYLRKAYINMDLHTDGTYVNESTDWILMTKIEEVNVKGGETVLLHLDDWEHLDELSKNTIGNEDLIWSSPKSKNVDYKVEHPVFKNDKDGNITISYIDQFPEPKNMEQGLFLQKLSDSLEGSKNKIITELPVGSSVLTNNHFWLHGRKPFAQNKDLFRELLRIRGIFN